MNNPALKRLARELKEIQQFKLRKLEKVETELAEINESVLVDEDCIDASPLKVH